MPTGSITAARLMPSLTSALPSGPVDYHCKSTSTSSKSIPSLTLPKLLSSSSSSSSSDQSRQKEHLDHYSSHTNRQAREGNRFHVDGPERRPSISHTSSDPFLFTKSVTNQSLSCQDSFSTSGLHTPPPDLHSRQLSSLNQTVPGGLSKQSQLCGPVLRQLEASAMALPTLLNPMDNSRNSHVLSSFTHPAKSNSNSNHYRSSSQSSQYSENRMSIHSYPAETAQPLQVQSTLFSSGSYPAQPQKGNSRNASSLHQAVIPPLTPGQKGSMPEFAAHIACLLWFESLELIKMIEDSPDPLQLNAPMHHDALPTQGFRRWLNTILSTTQVSENVVLLALLFVYRLKRLNPSVRGKTGSEFRLITVALMLGNKFLDDNTYTNKTWAEVSGITVQEIHIMEVEFLQNMKYNLYTSVEQWHQWYNKMNKFWKFWQTAAQRNFYLPSLGQPTPAHSPTNVQYPQAAPCLPALQQQHGSGSNQPYGQPVLEANNYNILPPVTNREQRKRSFDGNPTMVMEPPTKRVVRSMAPNISVTIPQYSMQIPPPLISPVRIPQRNSPTQAIQGKGATHGPLPTLPAMNFGVNFPEPGSRAMSMIYANQPHANAHQASQSITSNGGNVHMDSRNTSPHLQYGSNASSPNHSFPHHSSQNASPSFFLDNRSSPYRPVRGVSSLLISQPQGSLPPIPSINHFQYQSLTKNKHQYHNGVLPYVAATPNTDMQMDPFMHYGTNDRA